MGEALAIRSNEAGRAVGKHDPAVQRLRVLQVILVLGQTNSQYNQHCLPLREVYDISICTYFKPKLDHPAEIQVFAGDDTLRGFFGALDGALAASEYDVIHAHAPHTSTLLTLALLVRPRRWRLRRKLVYTVRDSFHDYKLRNKLLMLPALAFWPRVVFCGHAAQDSYPSLWKRLIGRRARVVQNAADLDRVDRAVAGAVRDRNGGTFEVLSVGRLESVKDPLTLLAALRGVDGERVRLKFVGAGSMQVQLAGEARSAGLENRVELTGLIPRDDVFVQFASTDLFVSASRGEGLPVAVIEAMATGCPVVLSDIPPHRELAEGVDFVPFVALGDAEGFAREIDRFRDMSPAERRAIGQKCQDLARSRFSLPVMHAAYEKVYGELR